MPVRVLIVENDADLADLLQTTLRSLGYEVLGVATDAQEAIEMGSRETPDIALVDFDAPGWAEAGNSIERALRAPQVSLTAAIGGPSSFSPEESGYFGYVTKPFDGPKLRAAIEVALFRHRLEEILRESEGRFEVTLAAMSEAVIVTDPNGTITFVNPAAERLLAVSRAGLLGRDAVTAIELVTEGPNPFSSPVFDALSAGGDRRLPSGCSIRDAEGDLVPVEGGVSVMRTRGTRVAGAVMVLRDASTQRERERELNEREERYRTLYMGDMWVSFALGGGGRILECSESFAELLGVGSREGVQGRSLREFLPVPLEYDYLSAVLRERGRILPHERTLRRIDGATIHVVISLESLNDEAGTVLARLVNVTERRRLQEQHEEIRRMEAVGRLAGGSAHTLINVFQVIVGSAGLISQEPLAASTREDVDRISGAAQHGSEIVRDLLSLGQRRMMRDRTLEASATLREMLPSLSERAGPGKLTLLQLPMEPLWVRCDPSLLSEVLGCLVDNAREAMPRGGSISFEITPVTVRPDEADWAGGVTSGDYVGVSVVDSGPGMDEDVRSQALDPFFSTKEENAGMGLPVAFGLARQQGGWLSVESTLGEGTRVTIHLPRVAEPSPGSN